MNSRKKLNKIRQQRKRRARAKIFGTSDVPRLSVFRSKHYTYIQLINDQQGETLFNASTKNLKNKESKEKKAKFILEEQLGGLIAKKALEKGVKKAVFDRGRYKYHGRIKEVAEGARKGGLQL